MTMTKIKIENKLVGDGEPTFIIAEIGSNHDGDLDKAKELIHAAAKSGADAVKFQSFSAEGLLNKIILKDGKPTENPSYNILKGLELPNEWHEELFDYSKEQGIIFLSAPFDEEKADLLNSIGVEAFKIASGDLTHLLLLKHVSRYKKPVIVSTGMSYIGEVDEAVHAIREEGNEEIILLHCVSNYPPKFDDCNINVIPTLKKAFNLPVGMSDHTSGIAVALGSIALGACMIEKHITFERSLPGPDHPYAMTIMEFEVMVKEIRNLEKALGSGIKEPVTDEIPERVFARRSIYAKENIKKGDIIKQKMLKVVRHGFGLEPRDIYHVVGRTAKNNIVKDEIITWDMI